MSISVGDVLRVAAIMYFTDGNVLQNVFSAVITGSGGPFDDADIVADAVAWLDDIYGNLTSTVSDTVDGSEAKVYVYDPVDDDYDEVGSGTWTWNPSHAGDPTARGVSLLINCKTTDPDVSGKKYFGGLTEDSMTDAAWIGSLITGAGLVAADWLTGFTGGTSGADWQPGVWSPKNTNFYAATGDATIPTEPAYQRRRKRGIGA